MKARIEKKLSKRLVELAPTLFSSAWVDSYEPSALADKQGTRVNDIWSVGGELDYWGEGMDVYTVWAAWTGCGPLAWCWHGDFDSYPFGHELAGYPDTGNFRPTTCNLLKLAAQAEAAAKRQQ